MVSHHPRSGKLRRAYARLAAFLTADHEHLVELDYLSFVGFHQINPKPVADTDLVLFAAVIYECIHDILSSF